MGQVVEMLLLVVLLGAAVVALLAAVGALFQRLVGNGRQAAERMPGRSFLLGLVNTLFLGAITLAFAGLGENLGVPVLFLPGLAALALLAAGATLGLAAVVELLAGRLFPARAGLGRTARAGAVLYLACLTPFVGWFALLPYAVMLGLGAVILGLFGGHRPAAADDQTVMRGRDEPAG